MGHTFETVADSWISRPGGSSVRSELRMPPRLGACPEAGRPTATTVSPNMSRPTASDPSARRVMAEVASRMGAEWPYTSMATRDV